MEGIANLLLSTYLLCKGTPSALDARKTRSSEGIDDGEAGGPSSFGADADAVDYQRQPGDRCSVGIAVTRTKL